MKTRKILATTMIASSLALGAVAVSAGSASAHTATDIPKCDSLSINASNYRGASISVKINGSSVLNTRFQSSIVKSFTTNGKGYSYSVNIVADDGHKYDFSDSGSVKACTPKPCPTVTVTKVVQVPGPTVTKTVTETKTATATVTETATATATVTAPGVTKTETATSTVTLPGKVKTKTLVRTDTVFKTIDSSGNVTKTQRITGPTGKLPRTGVDVKSMLELATLILFLGGLVTGYGKGLRIVRKH